MSSKRNRQKRNRYQPQPAVGPASPKNLAPEQNVFKRLLAQAQTDDIARMRFIIVFVVALLVIEFVVFAIALSGTNNVPLIQGKNAGQQVPITSSSGGGCSVGVGNNSPTSLNPQSPGAALQNSPVPQGQSSALGTGDSLQASPQAGQCF